MRYEILNGLEITASCQHSAATACIGPEHQPSACFDKRGQQVCVRRVDADHDRRRRFQAGELIRQPLTRRGSSTSTANAESGLRALVGVAVRTTPFCTKALTSRRFGGRSDRLRLCR